MSGDRRRWEDGTNNHQGKMNNGEGDGDSREGGHITSETLITSVNCCGLGKGARMGGFVLMVGIGEVFDPFSGVIQVTMMNTVAMITKAWQGRSGHGGVACRRQAPNLPERLVAHGNSIS